jgi:ABC-type multidrug transport system fused ATPase/permease subunit
MILLWGEKVGALITESLISGLLPDGIITLAKLVKKKPKERKVTLIILSILIVIDVIGILLNEIFYHENNIFGLCLVLLIIFGYIFLALLLSFIVNDSNVTVGEHLDKLAEERDQLNKKIEEHTNVMDVIRINLNQLNEYYTINKAQARKSYLLQLLVVLFFVIQEKWN